MKRKDEVLVGNCSVDAGIIMIGDPCYTHPDGERGENWNPPEDYGRNWIEFCNILQKKKFDEHGKAGVELGNCTAVVVHSGDGDGVYPVYTKLNKKGKVKYARIDFGV